MAKRPATKTESPEELRFRLMQESIARLEKTIIKLTENPKRKPKKEVEKIEHNWALETKQCKSCGLTKTIKDGFGLRMRDGVLGPQGWCGVCRAKTNYRAQDR